MTLFATIRAIISPAQAATKDCKGITALEYGLAAALVALVIIGGARTFGTNVSTLFTGIGTTVSGTSTTIPK
ncbi:Flp family type IVb pilin (plasmid) [Azospirillum argentinense]|uniref:Flp family type IVb pilin n=1 Tax=Azospirillum argentinense TaxID=2970906 RepID=A0A4D8PM42_9PROT|nr:Flp family type IVb pilin [Azospirillum argentinense]QCN99166.1 Flp family type IVb pilin [Azospirillum argentinense]